MGRDIFASTAATAASAKDPYICRGGGTAVILECMQKNVANVGDIFVSRMKILESVPRDGKKHHKGEVVTFLQNFTKAKYPKIPRAEVKAFVLAASGLRESEISGDQFIAEWENMINYVNGAKSEYNDRVITDVQSARGMIVKFTTYDKQTAAQKAASAAGKAFEVNSYPVFSHVPDQGDIEARIKELDASDPIRG